MSTPMLHRAHRTTIGRRLLFTLGLSLMACEGSAELVVVQGEHIDVHHMPDFELCGGTVDAYDRGIEFVADQLGLDPDSFDHMSFAWLDGPTFEEEHPSSDHRIGRASRDEAAGLYPFIFHEVVHMIGYQEKKKVNTNIFLTEGLAVAFQEKETVHPIEFVDPRPYLVARYTTSPPVNYDVAGTFVSFLLSRFGPERFWELNRDLGRRSTEGRFRRRFKAVYGQELDTVVETYLEGECSENDLPIPLPVSCAAEEIPRADDGTWTYARALDCAEDDVIGGIDIDGDTPIEHLVTFVIETSGDYDIRSIGDGPFRPLLYRCGGCPWLNQLQSLTSGHLEAGRYSLRFISFFDPGAGTVGFTIRPSDG